MVKVVLEVGSKRIYIFKGLRNIPIKSYSYRFMKQEVQVFNQLLVTIIIGRRRAEAWSPRREDAGWIPPVYARGDRQHHRRVQ